MKHNKKFFHSFLLPMCILLALILVACSPGQSGPGSGPTTGQPSQVADKASEDKQILIYPYGGLTDIATLDPALTTDVYSSQAIGMVFNGLVQRDDKGVIQPILAASYTLSPDGLTWTFTLRDNLKFSDGSALTSEDVVFTLDRVLQPDTKSPFAANALGPIKDSDQLLAGKIKTLIGTSLLAPDPKTVVIVTGKKAAYFLDSLSGPVPLIIQKSHVEKYGKDFTQHLDVGGGTGPWIVSKYERSKEIIFTPNQHYFGKKPQLKKVVRPFYKETDTTWRAFQANQVSRASVPLASLDTAKGLPGGQYHQVPYLATSWYTMNYLTKPFDNIKIRQAFALAIDKEQLTQSIYKGTRVPTNHIAPEGVESYSPDLTGPQGVKSPKGDPALARKLFDEGLQELGLTRETLPPIVFLVSSSGSADARNELSATQQMWQSALGISVKLDDIDFNKLVTEIIGNIGGTKVMAFAVGWQGTPDPYTWTTYHFGKNSQLNLSNYGKNPAANLAHQQQTQDLLEQADANVENPDERIKQYQQAEQELVNDVAWLPTNQQLTVYVLKPCVVGWVDNAFDAVTPDGWSSIYISNNSTCANTTQYQ